MTSMLEVRGLTRRFGGLTAVDSVDLDVAEHEFVSIIGPNGAGKTTLFNLLTGFLKPSAGQIRLGGRDVTGSSPERIAQLGVARSFQITNLFEQLTLQQHVELALMGTTKLGHRFWVSDRVLTRFRDRAGELLDEVGLARQRDVPAGTLAYGQKRALELALALALDPAVLLLDEPTAGMGMEDVERTVELVRRIRTNRTVVLVEHNMSVVAGLADRVTVLQFGQILTEGTYDEVRNDPRVIAAYLGGESAA